MSKALAFVCRLKIEIVPLILIVSFEIALGPEMGVLEFALLRFRSVEHVFKETVRLVPAKVFVRLGQGRFVQIIAQIRAFVCKLNVRVVAVILIANMEGVVIKSVTEVVKLDSRVVKVV